MPICKFSGHPGCFSTLYRSFMDQTAAIREMVYESTSQVEAYIDEQIERMRMERR